MYFPSKLLFLSSILFTTFSKSSQAEIAGGDLYISIGKSINIIDTNFTGSSAPKGSFLSVEEMEGKLIISKTHVKDIYSNDDSTFILAVSSGSIDITDSVFENINSPLLLISKTTVLMNHVIFNQVSCPRSANSFCLLKTTSSDSIKIANSSLTNINSNVDLISLSGLTQVLLSNVTAQNMLKITQESFLVPDPIYVLNALNIQNLNISESDFTRIGFSGIKAKDSSITIQKSTFSNNLKTGKDRSLRQATDESLYASKLREPIQFLVLDTSDSVLNSVSFSDNSLNTLVNGGV